MPLTPADVRNKQFSSSTRLRLGYDEEEVDAFLDEVEVELDRLIQENEELRSKLAESCAEDVCADDPAAAAHILRKYYGGEQLDKLIHYLRSINSGDV